jgi:hypothetical protein
MVFHILAAAATAATLISSNVVIDISGAQVAAVHYGRILGAAAQCHDIDQQRISLATHRASSAVHAKARSNQDLENARGSFEDAAMEGGTQVSVGKESCSDAEAALTRVEKEFAP